MHGVRTQILWNRLISIVDEAATGLVRSSYSSVVRDFHDYCCGVFDADGNLLAHSTKTTAGFLGIIPEVMRHVIRRYPASQTKPGDVFITNDPWIASGHLHDITIATPIFRNRTIVGYALCIVHHLDIGGRMATTESKDMYEEGLKLPILKFYEEGRRNGTVDEIIHANVRVSNKVMGDVNAQLAANEICARGLLRLLSEYRLDDLTGLAEDIIARSELSLRRKIAALPDGIYRNSVVLPEIAGCPVPITINVAVEIRDDSIVVDYTGSSGEVAAALNVVLNMTKSYTTYPIKLALDPDVPNNDGCLRPITVVCPAGTLLNCNPPAATWGRTIIAHNLPEIVFGAVFGAMPDRVIASCGSTPLTNLYMSGRKKNGQSFLVLAPHMGGFGASPTGDGPHCLSFPFNVANIPIEVTENDSPILYTRKRLMPDSGGPGQFRGGLGQEVEFVIADGAEAPMGNVLASIRGSGRGEDSSFPVFGRGGGSNGRCEALELNGASIGRGGQKYLGPGDRIRIVLPGGGGYGNPLDRDPGMVARDVGLGYVTPESARREYGVVFRTGTLEIDENATEQTRMSRRIEHV